MGTSQHSGAWQGGEACSQQGPEAAQAMLAARGPGWSVTLYRWRSQGCQWNSLAGPLQHGSRGGSRVLSRHGTPAPSHQAAGARPRAAAAGRLHLNLGLVASGRLIRRLLPGADGTTKYSSASSPSGAIPSLLALHPCQQAAAGGMDATAAAG